MDYSKSLDSLSLLNLEKVYALILDIDDKLQVSPSNSISISIRSVNAPKFLLLQSRIVVSISDRQEEFRRDALDYLKNIEIIKNYYFNVGESTIAIVKIDIGKFNELKKGIVLNYDEKLKKEVSTKNMPTNNKNDPLKDIRAKLEALATSATKEGQKEPLAGLSKLTSLIGEVELLKKQMQEQIDNKPANASQIIYEIKYTMAGEILLNNILLSKTNFQGENDKVFTYLFENPNKEISVKDLEQKTGKALTKPLHKIVENLGFKGDYRKVFFKISKEYILFRNPITQQELDKIGISRIKHPS